MRAAFGESTSTTGAGSGSSWIATASGYRDEREIESPMFLGKLEGPPRLGKRGEGRQDHERPERPGPPAGKQQVGGRNERKKQRALHGSGRG